MQIEFKKGDRVKLSPDGKRLFKQIKNPDRGGTITSDGSKGRNSPDCVVVHWDGLKSAGSYSIHIKFIEHLIEG